MNIKYRIGVMPGPWPADSPGEPDGREFLWRFIDLCERTAIDSDGPRPIPTDRDGFRRTATDSD